MPCYSPIEGWRAREINPATGKRRIVFNERDAHTAYPVTLACGQCIGCRLERSRQWAVRCVHEASLYQHNCFITLTYDNEHLPSDGSLHVDHFQKFMKRLRKEHGDGIRFFHCGEYGENFGRPHYHACVFNFDFADKKLWTVRNGVSLYVSENLQDLWPNGYSTVGDVTFESAAYVARYVVKKVTGERALEHYTEFDRKTGEILADRRPEYTTMSRRPGIGRAWLEKYKTDVYPDDFVIIGGKKIKPPKYYDNVFEVDNPNALRRVKRKRKLQAWVNASNCTWERLRVREEIQLLKFDLLHRGYENEI